MTKPNKKSLATAAYRQFRQQMVTESNSQAGAAQLYANNNLPSMVQRVALHEKDQRAIENILDTIRNKPFSHAESENNLPSTRPSPTSLWPGRLKIVMPVAFACMLVILLFPAPERNNSGEPVAFVPNSLVSPYTDKHAPLPMGDFQFNFVNRSGPESQQFLLGVTTTLLVLSARLEDETRMSFFATYLDQLSQTHAIAGSEIKQLANVVSRTDSNEVIKSVAQLEHVLDQRASDAPWFRIGQLVQSLRLAVLQKNETSDSLALSEVRQLIADYDLAGASYSAVPKAGQVLSKIVAMASSNSPWSRSDRREVMRYTDQMYVLLR